ncbi:hypothetical protein JW848_01540 [Candidatus Bipolaricaulota bacterium]|nr:hypothetical protein [Candidatus Bipolaricaulota bacterium]
MFEWIRDNNGLIWWTGIVSAGMLVLALLIAPWLVGRIPAGYFSRPHRAGVQRPARSVIPRVLWLAAKNLLAIACLLLGCLLLVLPGQGILTILIGIMLLDFPGKFRLQRWVVSRRRVVESINWLRQRRGKDPLVL